MSNKELFAIETRLTHLEKVLSAVGLPVSPWTSPAEAATILSTSRTTIKNEISRAEEARINITPTDLIWGTHYRKNGAHWQVNPIELEKVIFLPEENRPY